MGNLQALREHKSELARQANALLADKGAQVWAVEDQQKYDGIMDQMERVGGQITAHQRIMDAEAEKHFENVAPGKSKMADGGDVLNAVALYLRNGSNVTADQAIQIRNAMSTTTNAEGGFTVPPEVARMVIDAMKAFGGLRTVATVIQTDGGNALTFPASDGTAEVGEIVAENAAATAGDVTFTNVALNPYKYSSKKIALPWELIQDSGIDIVQFVVDRLATRLGRITNAHYATGTGTGQPFGITARAATGKTGTTGQTLTVIYDDLVDLFYSVNVAYRETASTAFMMNDSSVAIIRKLKDGSQRPIFVPSWDNSVTGATPDTILGRPLIVNNDMPVMAANAKSIAFGDFSKFYIRDVMGVTIRRFDDSAFALSGQVGFCGWTRTGSNLLDTAAVKVYVNSGT